MNKYLLIVVIILSVFGIFFYLNSNKTYFGIKKFNIRREEALKSYMKLNNIQDKDLVNYFELQNSNPLTF